MNKSPAYLLVFYHPLVHESESLADEIAVGLHEQYGVRADCALSSDYKYDESDLLDVDMFLAVGGDGTMLRVGRIGARHKIPVLGINLGRVGFLPEVNPDAWQAALARVMEGDYWLEERMLVYAEHWRDGVRRSQHHALNEVVVTRGGLARPVRLTTRIDATELTTYVADGLIIATPTGSTAYALAAGGPILPPELRNLVLIPVAPHFSFDRAIVLAQDTPIDIVVHPDHQAILSADGQVEIELQDGDQIHVRSSEQTVNFVRLQDRSYFYTNLTAFLGP